MATRQRLTCARPPAGWTRPSPPAWRGCGRSSTASRPVRTNSPPRCSPAGARNAAGGWPGGTWSSGPSAPARDCRFIDPAAGAGSLSDEPARPGPGPGGPLPCDDAATHGAGPAIARFNIAHYIIGSAAWVAALVMMALADVLTRLVMVYLRGRRLNAGPAAAPALIPASTRA